MDKGKAKVVGMVPVDERVQAVARTILDDVVVVQAAVSGCMTPVVVRQSLNSIQIQARGLLAGGNPEHVAHGPIGQGYRADMLEMLQGLAEQLAGDITQGEDLSDGQLWSIALAAQATHDRINNYLIVRQAENAMFKLDGGKETGLSAA